MTSSTKVPEFPRPMLNSTVVRPSPAADLFLASKLARIDVNIQSILLRLIGSGWC
jgi:hypothetical protein